MYYLVCVGTDVLVSILLSRMKCNNSSFIYIQMKFITYSISLVNYTLTRPHMIVHLSVVLPMYMPYCLLKPRFVQ